MLLAHPVEPRRPRPPERPLIRARPAATASPGSKRSARSHPFFAWNTAPAPGAGRAAATRASAVPTRRDRTDSAGGSSSDRPRAPARATQPASSCTRPNRHGRYGGEVELGLAGRDPLGERLAEPAGPTEAVQRQPGREPQARGPSAIGPTSGFASGVIASGWQTSFTISASSMKGNRRAAPRSSCSNRSMSGGSERAAVLPGRAVDPSSDRIGLVPAEHDAAGLGLPVDEVVRVAEARHVARQLRPPAPPSARCAGGRPASTGPGAPTIAATRGAQIPAASTTTSHSIRSPSTTIAVTSRRSESSIAVTRAPVRIVPPERARGRRERVRRGVRVEEAVAGHPDAPEERLGARRRHQPQRLVGPDRARRRGRSLARGTPRVAALAATRRSRRSAGSRPSRTPRARGTARSSSGGTRIIVGEGLNIVTNPAACAVDPLVSSPLSNRSTSVQPGLSQVQRDAAPGDAAADHDRADPFGHRALPETDGAGPTAPPHHHRVRLPATPAGSPGTRTRP